MPVRIPKTGATEIFCFGAAGVTTLAPLYMLLPGAEERLAAQTVKWAPRWERNITFFRSPVERGVKRVAPPIAKTIQKIENKMPLKKMALRADHGIKKNLDWMGVKRS